MFAAHSLLLVLCSSPLVLGQADVMVDLVTELLDLVGLDVDIDLNLGGGGGGSSCNDNSGCYQVDTCDRNLNDNYCEQPLFVKFASRNEKTCLIDNVCYTYFPLPDDPYTFNQYKSTVFMDGSFIIETSVVTDIELGRTRSASPCCTYVNNYIGYAGCDTFVIYRCNEFGDCMYNNEVTVLGLSPTPLPLGIACIEKVKDIMACSGISVPDIVLLPQALPHKCITEQLCINSIQGNFYRALNLPAPAVAPVVLV